MENLIYLFILVGLSAFFSASEIAIFSLSPAKVKSLEQQKKPNAKKLAKLKSNPQRLLVSILVCNNLVNIGASALATVIAYKAFGSFGPALATGLLTVVLLIFGEIGPKTFAASRAESFALAVAPILTALDVAIGPVITGFEKVNQIFISLFSKQAQIPMVSEEELRALAEIGVEEGVVEPKEKEMIKRVLEFNDIDAGDVMTTRHLSFALPATLTIQEALPKLLEYHFSRVPIYEKSADNITGVIYIHDILSAVTNNKQSALVSSIAKKPYFVPQQRKIDDLFKDFQRQRNHIAMVVNEHGDIMGLVTLEDLLEELVGEIMDESDIDEFLIKRLSKNAILVDANIEIKEIIRFLNIEISGSYNRLLSEIILEKSGAIPQAGESIDFGHFVCVIEKATEKKIEKVRVIKK